MHRDSCLSIIARAVVAFDTMIRFNDILRLEGLDPKMVRLVRHQDSRSERSLLTVWKTKREEFEFYQSIQSRRIAKPGEMIASFVVTPAPKRETVFVGIYEIEGITVAPVGVRDRVLNEDVTGGFQLQLRLTDHLKDYRGELRIDWGAGARSWVQRAHLQDKLVTAIREEPAEPFPGFEKLQIKSWEFDEMASEWVSHLNHTKGVYLLVETKTGKQYVGSATGVESLWGRWAAYANGGHGGDVELKRLNNPQYLMSVLRAVPMVYSDDDILAWESVWKDHLGTRLWGLNDN